ncbi:MAG: anthranilate phosphoribosyltransferase [Rhizobiales bacterium TMED168]|nr:MAG: anthranilate phosphoribosyltransferase [Rhizobiales bacterium TMED168]|tara:strand:- start:43518 stop:44531 length:1014 start_codon:yes stop_codon:yes gene_type:complete
MTDFNKILSKIHQKEGLSNQDSYFSFNYILEGKANERQIEKFLLGLRNRGEKIEEIIAATRVMREKSLKVSAPNSAIDTCGTGGSGSGKYNVSTAASLVAAGAGSIIAKHGNRSLSSKSGSSQVLEELGVKLDIEPKKITKCMERANIGFMFAPNHHPAMKYVGPVRQKLGVRTIFNILGPLSNPANVKKQLIGVFDKKWLKPMAETLKNLGSQRALLVNGSDGFDELTTTGISNVTELNEGNIVSYKINPKDLGLKLSKTNDLIGGDPKQNAKKIILLLEGERGPYRDIVLLNSAAALYVDNKVRNFLDGISVSKNSIDNGNAKNALKNLVQVSNS